MPCNLDIYGVKHIDYLHFFLCLFVCFNGVFPLLGKKKSHSVAAKGKQKRLQASMTELFLSKRAGSDPQGVLAAGLHLSKPGEKAGSPACMALAQAPRWTERFQASCT